MLGQRMVCRRSPSSGLHSTHTRGSEETALSIRSAGSAVQSTHDTRTARHAVHGSSALETSCARVDAANDEPTGGRASLGGS